jgi:hypothetical protein
MDLRPEFARAIDHVAQMNFHQSAHEVAPFFETVIRYLGGLLSAYAIVVDNKATSGISWHPDHFEYKPIQPIPATFDASDVRRVTEFKTSTAGQNESAAAVPTIGYADKQGFGTEKRPLWVESSKERQRIASVLLTRADHLARVLLPAFKTTSGLPVYGVNTVS